MLIELLIALLAHIYRDWSLAFITTATAAIIYHAVRRDRHKTFWQISNQILEQTFKYAKMLFVVAVLVITPLRYILVDNRSDSLVAFVVLGVVVALVCLWRIPHEP